MKYAWRLWTSQQNWVPQVDYDTINSMPYLVNTSAVRINTLIILITMVSIMPYAIYSNKKDWCTIVRYSTQEHRNCLTFSMISREIINFSSIYALRVYSVFVNDRIVYHSIIIFRCLSVDLNLFGLFIYLFQTDQNCFASISSSANFPTAPNFTMWYGIFHNFTSINHLASDYCKYINLPFCSNWILNK